MPINGVANKLLLRYCPRLTQNYCPVHLNQWPIRSIYARVVLYVHKVTYCIQKFNIHE